MSYDVAIRKGNNSKNRLQHYGLIWVAVEIETFVQSSSGSYGCFHVSIIPSMSYRCKIREMWLVAVEEINE